MKNFTGNMHGGVLVEFAITAPVVLFLLAVSIEFGNALANQHTVISVANDVAMVASELDSSDMTWFCDQIAAEARARVNADVNISTLPCEPPTPGTSPDFCDREVTVNVHIVNPPLLFGLLESFPFPLQSSTTVRYNNGALCPP